MCKLYSEKYFTMLSSYSGIHLQDYFTKHKIILFIPLLPKYLSMVTTSSYNRQQYVAFTDVYEIYCVILNMKYEGTRRSNCHKNSIRSSA